MKSNRKSIIKATIDFNNDQIKQLKAEIKTFEKEQKEANLAGIRRLESMVHNNKVLIKGLQVQVEWLKNTIPGMPAW